MPQRPHAGVWAQGMQEGQQGGGMGEGDPHLSSGWGPGEGWDLAPAPEAGHAGCSRLLAMNESVWPDSLCVATAGLMVDVGEEAEEASQERNSGALCSVLSFAVDLTKERG